MTAHPTNASIDVQSPVLEVHELGIDVRHDRAWVPATRSVSFSVRAGDALGIVGESGSGKSLTALALMGLLPQSARRRSGSVRVDQADLTCLDRRSLEDLRGERISMVFQEPMTSLNPAFKVGDQIAEVVRRHRGLNRRRAQESAVAALDRVGIASAQRRANSYPHEFSGGMRQRVMIALATVCEPDVLIADEPTTALDVTIQAQILDLLTEMRADSGMAMVLITHDLGVVAESCDRIAVMYGGEVVEEAPAPDLFARPGHPYTEALMASVLPVDKRVTSFAIIPGRPASPTDDLQGCRFAPRCPYAASPCREPQHETLLRMGRRVRCVRHDEIQLDGVES